MNSATQLKIWVNENLLQTRKQEVGVSGSDLLAENQCRCIVLTGYNYIVQYKPHRDDWWLQEYTNLSPSIHSLTVFVYFTSTGWLIDKFNLLILREAIGNQGSLTPQKILVLLDFMPCLLISSNPLESDMILRQYFSNPIERLVFMIMSIDLLAKWTWVQYWRTHVVKKHF